MHVCVFVCPGGEKGGGSEGERESARGGGREREHVRVRWGRCDRARTHVRAQRQDEHPHTSTLHTSTLTQAPSPHGAHHDGSLLLFIFAGAGGGLLMQLLSWNGRLQSNTLAHLNDPLLCPPSRDMEVEGGEGEREASVDTRMAGSHGIVQVL
jgi:hypothetical protein